MAGTDGAGDADHRRRTGCTQHLAQDTAALFETADTILPHFAGGNGRYRYAKAVELSGRADAVLTLAPRYENAAMILDMRGLRDACNAPLSSFRWTMIVERNGVEPPAFLPVLLLKKLNDKEPVRNAPDGFFASVVMRKSLIRSPAEGSF